VNVMTSRPFLIVALAGDDLLATAALSSVAADEWTVTLAGGCRIPVSGEARVRALLERLDARGGLRPVHGDEREDPEPGLPLPPGIDGFGLGRRQGRRSG